MWWPDERDSGVAVVHGCFSEGGDYILNIYIYIQGMSERSSLIPFTPA